MTAEREEIMGAIQTSHVGNWPFGPGPKLEIRVSAELEHRYGWLCCLGRQWEYRGWHDDRRNRFRLLLHVIIIITSVVPPELPTLRADERLVKAARAAYAVNAGMNMDEALTVFIDPVAR